MDVEMLFWILLLAIIAFGAFRLAMSHTKANKHYEGVLAVRDSDNQILWSKELTPIRRDHMMFNKSEISVLARINKLVVRQAQTDSSDNAQIRVDIFLDTGGIVKDQILSVGEEYQLGSYDLWLTYSEPIKSLTQSRAKVGT